MQAEGWQERALVYSAYWGRSLFIGTDFRYGSVLKKGNGSKAHFPLMCRLCLKPMLNG